MMSDLFVKWKDMITAPGIIIDSIGAGNRAETNEDVKEITRKRCLAEEDAENH
jgi:hypothetical protein